MKGFQRDLGQPMATASASAATSLTRECARPGTVCCANENRPRPFTRDRPGDGRGIMGHVDHQQRGIHAAGRGTKPNPDLPLRNAKPHTIIG